VPREVAVLLKNRRPANRPLLQVLLQLYFQSRQHRRDLFLTEPCRCCCFDQVARGGRCDDEFLYLGMSVIQRVVEKEKGLFLIGLDLHDRFAFAITKF
jgi:hypothetical protein